MVRGHDHVEERYYVLSRLHSLSHSDDRSFIKTAIKRDCRHYERVPTIALYTKHAVPQVFRLKIPSDLVREIYPETIETLRSTVRNERRNFAMRQLRYLTICAGALRGMPRRQVRYFCTNHEPGRWLETPKCPECGAEYGVTVPPPAEAA